MTLVPDSVQQGLSGAVLVHGQNKQSVLTEKNHVTGNVDHVIHDPTTWGAFPLPSADLRHHYVI